jgi:hypothetical protein
VSLRRSPPIEIIHPLTISPPRGEIFGVSCLGYYLHHLATATTKGRSECRGARSAGAPRHPAGLSRLQRQSAHFAGQCTSVQARGGCAGRRGVRAVQIRGLPSLPTTCLMGSKASRTLVDHAAAEPDPNAQCEGSFPTLQLYVTECDFSDLPETPILAPLALRRRSRNRA